MPSRVRELADLVVEALIAANPPGATPETTFERVSLGKLRDRDYTSSITGRKVLVHCEGYLQADSNTRGTDRNAYIVTAVVARRYTDTAGPPAEEWVDGEIEWVQEHVYDALSGSRKVARPKTLFERGIWCEEAVVETLYDDDFLDEDSLFLSVLRFEFRRNE